MNNPELQSMTECKKYVQCPLQTPALVMSGFWYEVELITDTAVISQQDSVNIFIVHGKGPKT